MKVLVVMNSTDVTFGGGIVQVILNYCSRLSDEVDFDYAINERPGSNLHKMFKNIGKDFYCIPNKKKNLPIYIRELFKICKSKHYDVIHVHGNSANMLLELGIARLTGIKKRIAHCHNSQCAHPKFNKLLSPIFKKQYTNAIACSKKAGSWLYGEDQFVVLHNAININKYIYNEQDRLRYRQKLSLNDDVILVGHVGSINEQKNHEFLINIFNELQKEAYAELIIIGKGILYYEVLEQVRLLGLEDKVHFLGIRDDVEKWMCAMDVMVFPSKWEGLPLTLVEAQASGLSLIVSDVVTREICLTDKIHYLSLNDDSSIWKNAIEEVVKDNLRTNAVNLMKEYDITHESKKLLDLYKMN